MLRFGRSPRLLGRRYFPIRIWSGEHRLPAQLADASRIEDLIILLKASRLAGAPPGLDQLPARMMIRLGDAPRRMHQPLPLGLGDLRQLGPVGIKGFQQLRGDADAFGEGEFVVGVGHQSLRTILRPGRIASAPLRFHSCSNRLSSSPEGKA